jgi:hypothetical protein
MAQIRKIANKTAKTPVGAYPQDLLCGQAGSATTIKAITINNNTVSVDIEFSFLFYLKMPARAMLNGVHRDDRHDVRRDAHHGVLRGVHQNHLLSALHYHDNGPCATARAIYNRSGKAWKIPNSKDRNPP